MAMVDGIETTTGRIASLRELERLKRQEGLEWRCSGKIRKQVMERKVLIYAVLRRLPEPASESAGHVGSLSACESYKILLLSVPNHMLIASLSILQSYGISLLGNEGNALHKCA